MKSEIGENRSQAIEPAERLVRLLEQALDGIQAHRRSGRERRRHGRSDALLAIAFDDVAAQSRVLVLSSGHKILSLAVPLRKDMPFFFR
jgi:plasmid stabilization system protein ParE